LYSKNFEKVREEVEKKVKKLEESEELKDKIPT
jgi:hypothetical protein